MVSTSLVASGSKVVSGLNYNAMFYQTFICFCLNEAKRLCLNHCS